MTQIFGKSAYLAQKSKFYKRATNKHSWKFSKVKFWPKPNTQLTGFIKDSINALKLKKKIKINWSFKKTGPSYNQIFVYSDNSRQNIWNRIQKSIRIGEDNKSLTSNFAYFLTAIVKV